MSIGPWMIGPFATPRPDRLIINDPWAITDDGRSYRVGAWPVDVAVPPPPMRGRMSPAPLGDDEGQLCVRAYGTDVCFGRIEYLPDASLGSCLCSLGNGPCSYCVSTMPECTRCGWRMDYD